MVYVIENGQGLSPCVTGGLRIACTVVRIAEMGQGGGLPPAFFAVGQQVQGFLVADGSLLVLGEPVVDIAEAVPGVGLVEPVV